MVYDLGILYDDVDEIQDLVKAERYLRTAIDGFRQTVGSENGSTVIAETALTDVLLQQRRYSEAEPLLLHGLHYWEKVDPNPENLSSYQAEIATVRHAQGRNKEASELLGLSLAPLRKYVAPDSRIRERAEELAKRLHVP